ncbi:MAG: hypothetical protein EOO45_08320 [Flavobacterium sp.]|nr:MAG: hypothetical protein EOO45_08320 [Flavobacterium sp.]
MYNFSRAALLNRIGLSPSKKLLVFFISAVVVTIPLGYVYNSIAIILFVLYSFLSARGKDFRFNFALIVPILLFGLMALSVVWTRDTKSSIMALSKEASLLFIPIAFSLARALARRHVNSVLSNFSMAMCLYGLYFVGRAIVQYYNTGDPGVFFYHEFATVEINAVYLSALFSLSLFYYISKPKRNLLQNLSLAYIILLVLLLASKTVIILDGVCILAYYIFQAGISKKTRVTAIIIITVFAVATAYFGKITDRFYQESRIENNTAGKLAVADSHCMGMREAWEMDKFKDTDCFTGLAFRAYQIRIFTEMLQEDPILLTGYGLNASLPEIERKGREYNVYQEGCGQHPYNKMNFHNQYVEAFADLGIIGFLLIIVLIGINLKNAIKTKYFVHIAFAVLMISLFLTESFLWRQRGVVFFTTFYCLFNSCLIAGFTDKKEL